MSIAAVGATKTLLRSINGREYKITLKKAETTYFEIMKQIESQFPGISIHDKRMCLASKPPYDKPEAFYSVWFIKGEKLHLHEFGKNDGDITKAKVISERAFLSAQTFYVDKMESKKTTLERGRSQSF
jgi:hypothetical protein